MRKKKAKRDTRRVSVAMTPAQHAAMEAARVSQHRTKSNFLAFQAEQVARRLLSETKGGN